MWNQDYNDDHYLKTRHNFGTVVPVKRTVQDQFNIK